MYQFKKHLVQEQDNQLVISLYLDIPNVEFAEELGKSRNEQENLENSAKSYLQSKFPNLKNATVKIMAGTMLISTLAFGAASLTPNKAAAAANDSAQTTTADTTTQEPDATTPTGDAGTTTDTDETTPTDDADTDDTTATDEDDTTPTDANETTPSGDTTVSFKDTGGTYFTEAVEVLVDKEVVKGVTKDAFVPYRDVTRAEAAAMLARALGLDTEQAAGDSVFTDVSSSSDFYGVISALKDAKVIDGYDDGSFKPNQTITRAELAKMIVSTFENLEEKPDADLPFTDVGENSTFKNYIAAIYDAGITQGSTETSFDPYKNTRRAEAAAMIYRSINVDLFGQANGLVPIEEVSDTSVTVNGKEFTISNDMKKLLKENNNDILKDAVVYLSTDKDDTVQKIRYLEIKKSGTEESPLSLDGGNVDVHGPLIISGDYLSISNITVKGETTIKSKTAEVISAANNTTAGDIILENTNLGAVNINGNVHVETKGSSISKLIANSNAIIDIDDETTIPDLVINEGATNVEVNGSVTNVEINTTKPFNLAGKTNVDNLKVTNTGTITLGIEGNIGKVEFTNKDAKITINEKTKIANLVIPTGVEPSQVIENYEAVKQNIQNVNDNENPDADPVGGGGGTTPGDAEAQAIDSFEAGFDESNTIEISGDNANAKIENGDKPLAEFMPDFLKTLKDQGATSITIGDVDLNLTGNLTSDSLKAITDGLDSILGEGTNLSGATTLTGFISAIGDGFHVKVSGEGFSKTYKVTFEDIETPPMPIDKV